MNTIKIKYGLEEITARVPGLFPYIEFDENHVSTIHPASDSVSGCYGKIVCAITIPAGIFLDVEHENIDEDGEVTITIEKMVISGLSYSYNTLMQIYYQYKDRYPSNSFILFMEKGIGKFEITRNNVNSTLQPSIEPVTQEQFDSWGLVPEYEYYANCGRLWDEYTKIGIMCNKYQQIKEITGEINCEMECLVEKYSRMGGDIMRDYYGNLAHVSDSISAEYFNYLSHVESDIHDWENNFNLELNLNITSSENDLGILNTYIQFFGEKYVNALYVVEENRVVRIVREVDPDDPTHPRSQDTMTADETYYLESTCTLEAVRGVDYFLPYVNPNNPDDVRPGDFVIYNDRTYVCKRPTMNGEWPASSEDRFELISDTGSNNEPTVYIPPFNENEYYYRGEFVRLGNQGQVYSCDLPEYIQYNVGDVINIGDKYFIKYYDEYYDEGNNLTLPYTIQSDDEYYYKGPEIYHGSWSYDIFKPKDISGLCNSKLIGFRNNSNFIDAGGNIRRPENNVDWLWYYHIGDIGFHETTTDKFNNIMLTSGTSVPSVPIGRYETNLMAYGDIITNITRNEDDRTITFEYVIGAHLKAIFLSESVDDDGNTHYCYGDFEYDDNDLHGVKYVETYGYNVNSDINRLDNENFQRYVTYGDVGRRIDDMYSVCEISRNTNYRETRINGVSVGFDYIPSEFSANFSRESDVLCSPITKFDYLTGTTYKPDVKCDVHVRRGNAAAWERHMKLGELKTFEDLESYSNGGFFILRTN